MGTGFRVGAGAVSERGRRGHRLGGRLGGRWLVRWSAELSAWAARAWGYADVLPGRA